MRRVPPLFLAASIAAVLACAACSGSNDPPARAASDPAGTSSPAVAPPAALSAAEAFQRVCEGPASVPLEIAGSRHFVRVTLTGPKGTETVRLHVDTGGNTPGVVLHQSVADRLGFPSAESLPRALAIGDVSIPLPEGASFRLVDDTSEGARANPLADHRLRKDWSAGQIGAGFLSRYLLCIDPLHGRLGLGDPAQTVDDTTASWVPIGIVKGGKNAALYPFVEVAVMSRDRTLATAVMLFDSGAASSMLERAQIRALKLAEPGLALAEGAAGDADMIGGQFAEAMLRVDGVSLTAPDPAKRDGVAGGRPPIPLGSAILVGRGDGTWDQMFGPVDALGKSHGALGNDVLGRHRWIIDYRRERLFVERGSPDTPSSAALPRVGVALQFGDDGCPILRQVTTTNAGATKSALKPGDTLLAVDGADACKLYHHELAQALAGPPGSSRKLKLRRERAVIDVDVPVADLFAGPAAATP